MGATCSIHFIKSARAWSHNAKIWHCLYQIHSLSVCYLRISIGFITLSHRQPLQLKTLLFTCSKAVHSHFICRIGDATVSWDSKVIVFIAYLQKGRFINGECHANLLIQLCKSIKTKRSGKLRKIFLGIENAAVSICSHMSIICSPTFKKNLAEYQYCIADEVIYTVEDLLTKRKKAASLMGSRPCSTDGRSEYTARRGALSW